MQTSMLFDLLRTIFSALIVIGFVIGFFQVRAALRISRANVLLRLIQEYSSPEVYEGFRYIHALRREWKSKDPDYQNWSKLADQWVEEHAVFGRSSNNPDEKRKAEEWWKRRVVSQFIAKMGYLMMQHYISRDDFFGVVPELPRALIVLGPIEKSISKHFLVREAPVATWDVPFDKMVFESLMDEHGKWFKRKGKAHLSRQESA